MAISKRLRFEILRRDNYSCFYCGRRAPNVILEIDHRIPRCQGGPDSEDNLVAACWDCNRGKGPLSELEDYERYISFEEWKHEQEKTWTPAGLGEYVEDEIPDWMLPNYRKPLVINFDFYSAAAELPSPRSYPDLGKEAFDTLGGGQ